MAAGCTLEMPLEQAVELVRGRMEKALAEVMEQGATL